MAVKIRLARRGRKKLAIYDVVVADARSPRDGRFIEKVGTYNPNTDPATIVLDNERAFKWVMDGAIPTDTVRAILSYRGVMYRKHLQVGVNKGAITQEEADKRLADWIQDKESKIQAKIDGIAKKKAADAKERFDAETKVKEARTEALKKKAAAATAAAEPAAEEAPEAEAAEAPVEEAAAPAEETVAEAPATEEAPAAEAAPEEAPAAEAEAPAEEAAPKEEAPAEEAPEAKAEEAPAEAKAEEATVEAPAEEEAKAEDKKEEAPEADESEDKK